MEICYIEMTTVLYSLFRCPRPIYRVVRLTRVSLTVKIREINFEDFSYCPGGGCPLNTDFIVR